MNSLEIADGFEQLHELIVNAIEQADGKSFRIDKWQRAEGGGGITAALENGNIIEKGGIAFSHVHGLMPDKIAKGLKVDIQRFHATGVSLIQHPHNPFVPTIHMNVRYFELENGIWWFGGGIDLTPFWPTDELVIDFHQRIKKVCDKYDVSFYPEFKKWADDYFFLPHRNEMRGVGGIFFDRLTESRGLAKNSIYEFCLDIGKFFASYYSELMHQNHAKPFDELHKKWQLIRRGRYVEFNLLYDKGTQFGLQTDGRVESILMSMPAQASWVYNYHPETGTPEHSTLHYFQKGNDWVGMIVLSN